jgi:hypothetical protein
VSAAVYDGVAIARAEVPASVSGAHTLELTMNGRWPAASVHEVASRFAPATPRVTLRNRTLAWTPVTGAAKYAVYTNGVRAKSTERASMIVPAPSGLREYQVLAIDSMGVESFLSEPVRSVAPGDEVMAKLDTSLLTRDTAGYTGAGYLPLHIASVSRTDGMGSAPRTPNDSAVPMRVRIERPGMYAIDARYANGNGPVNTEDKVAVRTLRLDGDTLGVIVMPQRGAGRWSDWGWSNVLLAELSAGTHTLTLTYTQLDANMNGHINSAYLDYVRLTRLPSERRASR